MLNIKTYSFKDWEAQILNGVLAIDSLVFEPDLQGSFVEELGKFTANRDIYIFLYDVVKNHMIGYLTVFPIKEELHKKILTENRLFDTDISGEMIERYEPNKHYNLFMLSTAIRPEYQGKGLSKQIIRGFFKYIKELKEKHIYFDSFVSTAVTDGGRRFLKEIGLSKIKTLPKGYDLYELKTGDDDSLYSRADEYLLNMTKTDAFRVCTMIELESELIRDLITIDAAVFSENLRGTFGSIYKRFIANRDVLALLYESSLLIGYMCFFPICGELREQICCENRLFDADITDEMVALYEVGKKHHLYLISAAVLPAYQGKGASKHLICSFYKQILTKREQGIGFESALSTAVTDGGRRMLEKMGFCKIKTLCDECDLYELQFSDDVFRSIEEYVKKHDD
jgi:GNAT superfamily N-acetyltransferase